MKTSKRRPEEFTDKNVLVIGVGPSGTDISIDLLSTARKVSLLGGKKIPNLPEAISMSIGNYGFLKFSLKM